jgi:hypothetical protein
MHLLNDAPTRVMTDTAIYEYCNNARDVVANRNVVYLYCKGNFINKFTTITKAYNSCPELPISFKGVYTSLKRNGKSVVGDYTFNSKPL